MATKTLTITENAYNLIVGSKSADESFSEFFVRKFGGLRIADLVGYLKEGDAEAMKTEVRKFRKEFDKSMGERYVRIRQLSND